MTVGKWGVNITLIMANQIVPIMIPNSAPYITCLQVWYWRNILKNVNPLLL